MKDLLTQKKEIVEEHLPRIMELQTKANIEILKVLTAALKDHKIDAKVHFGILDKLKLGLSGGGSSSIAMDSQHRLDLARMWFDNAKAQMDVLGNDVKLGYQSYLNDIDKQMEFYREEVRQIDEKLKTVENENERNKLRKGRRKALKKK